MLEHAGRRSVLALLVVLAPASCGGADLPDPPPSSEDDPPEAPPSVVEAAVDAPADAGIPPVRECEAPEPTWIWCDDFERDRLSRYFEYTEADGSFVRAEGVGLLGSVGMRARFRKGQVDAGSLKLAFGRTPQAYFRPVAGPDRRYREIFWRFYLRYEEDWTGGGGDKLTRATSFSSPDAWAQAMIAHVWSGSGPTRDRLVLDPASGVGADGRVRTRRYNDFDRLRWLGNRPAETALFAPDELGRWHCVEAHVRLNDPGHHDGLFELWIDDRLEVRLEGLNWVGSFEAYGVNALFLENYWNEGAPRNQERYFDALVVSSDRIGCGS